jgi:beta-lactamase class D
MKIVSTSPILNILLFLLSTSITHSAVAQTLNDLFKEQKIEGSTTLYDFKNKRWHYSDSVDATVPMQPASTFKVINLLIGLETKTIADENSIIRWPGKTDTTLYSYRPEIYKDITIKEAFEVSAGWAYVEMAKKIPRKKYLTYLRKSG